MIRKPIIAGNWKMYKTISEAVAFVEELKRAEGADSSAVEVVLCPPFTALYPMAQALKGAPIGLGAQNMHWEAEGAFTGEVSPYMLKEAGCTHVIIGHSERRQFFGETDEGVNKKVKAALAVGLIPMLCVGELLAERESGITEKVIKTQTVAGLAGLTGEHVSGLVIAYEPVWAIGTGKTASDADAQQVNAYIRTLVGELYDANVAAQVRIQYGGSVKPDNAAGLMGMPDIDGALVGGASLDVNNFCGILKAIRN